MNAVNHRFELTARQRWHMAFYGLIIAVAFSLLAAFLGNTDIDASTLGIVYLITFGFVTGISLRLGTKRGWMYYAEKYQPDARYVFTKSLKVGVLWRVLAVWFTGRIVSIILLNQADSDLSMGLLLLLSTSLVVTTAMYVGLRFGWKSANTALLSGAVAVAS